LTTSSVVSQGVFLRSVVSPTHTYIAGERLPSWLTVLDTVSFGAAGDGSAFQALTTRSMALFNEQVPDDPNVKYYSWGAHYQPGWFDPLRWSHDCIQAVEGDNDGLVSVESSKWGEFRGVLIGCSHVDT
jgi:triacylglycerol lipase